MDFVDSFNQICAGCSPFGLFGSGMLLVSLIWIFSLCIEINASVVKRVIRLVRKLFKRYP